MGRTKFGNAPKGKTRKKIVRLPNGQELELHVLLRHVRDGDKATTIYVVQCPIEFGIVKDQSFFSFDKGFARNGYCVYLPKVQMWLFDRTATSMHDFNLMLRYWVFFFFGGKWKKAERCIYRMNTAQSRKVATRVRTTFYEKYGIWQFGLKRITRTRGLDKLLKRKKEFAKILEPNVFKEIGTSVNKQLMGNPRIAWNG